MHFPTLFNIYNFADSITFRFVLLSVLQVKGDFILILALASNRLSVPPSVSKRVNLLTATAGGRVTTDTARPTKRVSAGAEAVEDAPLGTCIERNDTNGPPCRCSLVPWLFFTILPPNPGFCRCAAPFFSPPLISAVTHKQLVQPFK